MPVAACIGSSPLLLPTAASAVCISAVGAFWQMLDARKAWLRELCRIDVGHNYVIPLQANDEAAADAPVLLGNGVTLARYLGCNDGSRGKWRNWHNLIRCSFRFH